MHSFLYKSTCYKYNIYRFKIYKFDFPGLILLELQIDLNKIITLCQNKIYINL